MILDPRAGQELKGQDVEGVLAVKIPWPSMARSVWRAHPRYMDTYFNVYKDHYVSTSLVGQDLVAGLLIVRSNPVHWGWSWPR